RDHLGQLPAWGQPADPATLPASFRKRDPNKVPKLREPEAPGALIQGLAYEYFEGVWSELPDFDALKPVVTGTAEQFEISKRRQVDASWAGPDLPRRKIPSTALSRSASP